MKKIVMLMFMLMLEACAQDPYRLRVKNDLAGYHGKSVYYRSNLRSIYAVPLRRTISEKFGEMGLKPAAVVEDADLVAIFDIETFYKQDEEYKNKTYNKVGPKAVLFTDDEESDSLGYSGNADMKITQDQTCFTMNAGPKGTSQLKYQMAFCANKQMEVDEILPQVFDVLAKYATYQYADVGVQCLPDASGSDISCNPIHDRQQMFVDSLWREHDITD